MKDKEIYISIDIESDGPIPGPNSMLSLGAAAFDLDNGGHLIDTFEVNFELLEGAEPDPDTADFWAKNKHAYERTRVNTVHPITGMERFRLWIDSVATPLSARPVATAFPASFDFMFVYWYLVRFTGDSPFGFHALDMKTAAALTLNIPFKTASKRNFPRAWFPPGKPHTHVAVDDAIEQGHMFVNMMKQHGWRAR